MTLHLGEKCAMRSGRQPIVGLGDFLFFPFSRREGLLSAAQTDYLTSLRRVLYKLKRKNFAFLKRARK